MGSDIERQEFERQRLERMAFGKPTAETDAAAAQDALRQLVAKDEAETLNGPPEAAADEVAVAAIDEVGPHDDELQERPARRLLPLVAVIGFIALVSLGFWLGRLVPAMPAHVPNPSGSLFAEFAPSTTFQQVSSASSSAALAQLALPQKSGDVPITPDLVSSLGLERRSLHRVLEVSNGITLWVGRIQKAARIPTQICMMFTGGAGSAVGASCATPKEFNSGGLAVQAGTYSFTWDGTTFTTTSTG